VERLKTGTPPRLDGRTLDYTRMTPQPGDVPTPVMSFLGDPAEHPRQVACHITATCERTHEIIRAGLDRSPMYSGVIEGVGPRYCPSVEDKVVRFADKPSHQIFVEPEGLDTHEVYPNGISTSLPFDVQWALVRSIPGFEAGQINGTTGYEEAAAQGLIAGLNAARRVRGEAPWTPRRDEAYIGVLIDDLVTRGTNEPYRMFTSRAEYRLKLREDTCASPRSADAWGWWATNAGPPSSASARPWNGRPNACATTGCAPAIRWNGCWNAPSPKRPAPWTCCVDRRWTTPA